MSNEQIECCHVYVAVSLREKFTNGDFFSGSYFPVFGQKTEIYSVNLCSPNTGKCGAEKTPYFDTFHTVLVKQSMLPV